MQKQTTHRRKTAAEWDEMMAKRKARFAARRAAAAEAPAARCSQCGTTALEDVSMAATRANDGYSLCCNEPVRRG